MTYLGIKPYQKFYKARKLTPLEIAEMPIRADLVKLDAGYIGYNKRTWHGQAHVTHRFCTDDISKLEPLKAQGYRIKVER